MPGGHRRKKSVVLTDVEYIWDAARIYSTWIPIGDVPEIEGALLILENSHRLEELKNTFMGRWTLIAMLMDLMPVGGLDETLLEVQEQLGGRWLTADFNAGDMLVFTLHCSPANRIRITSDTRYQLASEPIDERWIGDDPIAHSKKQKPKT